MSDCISRQEIEEIKEIMTDISGDSVYVARMSDIRALPSITPTITMPRHLGESSIKRITKELLTTGKVLGAEMPTERTGHWKMDRKLETRQCDKCMTVYRWSFNPHNYCPNCGAKMESGDNE